MQFSECNMTMIVGLTGGIGSGKSTVEKIFMALGVTVIDADQIAQSLSEPGMAGYQAITEHFGADVLQPNGHIDRRKLRDIIFNDEAERRWMENTLHPLVRHEMLTRAAQSNAAYCILSIPLLTETKNFDNIDRVLVVDAPEELQISRSCERDHMLPQQIEKIMQAQSSRDERLTYADDVILNDQSIDDLQHEVELLHKCYTKLSHNRSDEQV